MKQDKNGTLPEIIDGQLQIDGFAGEDKPTPKPEITAPEQQPEREIPSPSVPTKEIPEQPLSTPEIAEEEDASREKKQKKEKKKRLSRRERKAMQEQELEENLYEDIQIRSFSEIQQELRENGPTVSETTSSFAYLYDNTQELPKVSLSKAPDELRKERKVRAEQAVEDALADDPKAAKIVGDSAILSVEQELEKQPEIQAEDKSILIDGFDYLEWRRTTQTLPKLTDDFLAQQAEEEKTPEQTLPVQVQPRDEQSEQLPVTHTVPGEVEAPADQASSDPQTNNADAEAAPKAAEPAAEAPAAQNETVPAKPDTPTVPEEPKEETLETPKAESPAETAETPEDKEPETETVPQPPKAEESVKDTAPADDKEPAKEAIPQPPKAKKNAEAPETTERKEPSREAAPPSAKTTPKKKESSIKKPAAASTLPAEPAVHFVPVADPERYRFQQIPIRTFRIDQINSLLVAEIEAYHTSPKTEAPIAAEPAESMEPGIVAEQPAEERSSRYGQVISIAANGNGSIKDAIDAAIAQADKAEKVIPPIPKKKAKPVENLPEPPEIVVKPKPKQTPAAPADTAPAAAPETQKEPETAEATTPAATPETTAAPAASTAESQPAASAALPSEPISEAPEMPAEEMTETPEESTGKKPEAIAKSLAASKALFGKITSLPKQVKKEQTEDSETPSDDSAGTDLPVHQPESGSDSKPSWKSAISFLHKQENPAGPADPVTEKPDSTEYTPDADARKISQELKTATRELQIRTFVTGISTAALLILGLIYEKCIPASATPIPYLILNLLLVLIPAAVCFKTIVNGIKALCSLQGNTDSGISIAVLATLIHAVSLFFGGGMVMSGAVHLYSSIAVGALLVNALGKLSMMNRIARNFIFVTSADTKCSVTIYDDINTAIQLAKGCVVNEAPKIAYQQKTKFLKNFLQHSYESDPSMRTSQLIAPIALVASVVLCIVTMIITGNVIIGLGALSVSTCISAPIASLLCVNLPVANLCSLARRHGAMLVGYEAVERLSSTNAVMIDSTDLFPTDSVSLADIKVFSKGKIDQAILNAAAVMSNTGGTLRDLFEGVITSQREMLPKATNITYMENRGISGIVAGREIMVGNRAMMEENAVFVPEAKNLSLKANQCVAYLAEEGEVIAMLTITYEPDRNTVQEMQRLERCGIAVIVRTLDPNLTVSFLSTLFLVDERSIKVLPQSLGDYCDETLRTETEEGEALLATRGKAFAMMRMLSACVRQKHNISITVAMQIVSVILGFILVAFLSCYAGVQQLSSLAIFIYEIVWLAAIIIIPKLRKP